MTHKSMDIWTITKAAGKGTTDLLSNHLFSTNECNELNLITKKVEQISYKTMQSFLDVATTEGR